MKPTVGRIVHYFIEDANRQTPGMGQGPYAAIITRVHSDVVVDLMVLQPADVRHAGSVIKLEEASEDSVNYWTWPPRI
jgi:hypothetical protein